MTSRSRTAPRVAPRVARPAARRTTALRGVAAGLCLAAVASPAGAEALGGQWYVGAGGGASLLEPNSDAGLDVEENGAAASTLFLGTDLDARSSVQLQLYGLGEAELEGGEAVDYLGGDAAVLYRFFDTRDSALVPRTLNLAFYGRFGLGFMERDTDASLEDDSPVWFGAGAGLELGLGRLAALRLEGIYHDTDAGSALLSVLVRFGGARAGTLPPVPGAPAPAPDVPPADPDPAPDASDPIADLPDPVPDAAVDPAPDTAAVPPPDADAPPPVEAVEAAPARAPAVEGAPDGAAEGADGDTDGDGVADANDPCPDSAPGFPVRDNGCPLLDGVLDGVRFASGAAELLPGATDQLDYLAGVLAEYPRARVELHAHTDDFETLREQAILTRARLRTVGTYLVGRGVSANRLVLRSFGGSRPIADNATEAGRERNNRIEVLESVRR